MAHPCPARDCPRQIPKGLIACDDHWHQLPSPLRAEWQATSFAPKTFRHAGACMAAIDWLQRNGRSTP